MRKSIIISSVLVVSFIIAVQMGCGPNCAKIITTKSPDDLNYEDAVRINDFVKRRAAAMKEAEGGNMYAVEEAKNTVIACEFAIQMMVQVKNLYEEKNKLYDENLTEINDTRCFLDESLASKGKLMGKGKAAFLSTGTCTDIRARHEKFENLFGEEGTLSETGITDVYKKGVKAKKKGAKDKDGKAPAEEEGASEGGGPENEDIGAQAPAGGEGTAGADDQGAGGAGDESGDKGSGKGGMDSF
jgi:hypothetical protein